VQVNLARLLDVALVQARDELAVREATTAA